VTGSIEAVSNIGSDSSPQPSPPTPTNDTGPDPVTPDDFDGETTTTLNRSELSDSTIGRIRDDVGGPVEVDIRGVGIGPSPVDSQAANETFTPDQRAEIRQRAASDSELFDADDLGVGEPRDDGTVEIRTPETQVATQTDLNGFGNPIPTDSFGRTTNTGGSTRSLSVSAPTGGGGDTEIIGIGEDFPTSLGELRETDFGRDEILSTELPVQSRGIRRSVSGATQDALGIDVRRDIERRTATATTDFLADTAGVSSSGFDIDDSALANNQQAQTAAGLATTAVATPEPISTGTGAAVLGGLALGAGAVGVANELGTPDDRDANGGFGTQELGIGQSNTQTTELGIGSIDTTELDTPTQGGAFDGGELSPPTTSTGSRNPAEQPFQTGELVQPGLVRDEVDEEVIILPEEESSIFDGEESFQRDYIERRQEQFDLPDRRENRDAFVFPGEPVESPFESGEAVESGFGSGFGTGTGTGTFAGESGFSATLTGQDNASAFDTTPGLQGQNIFDLTGQTTQTTPTQTETTTNQLFENAFTTPTQPATRTRPRTRPRLDFGLDDEDDDEEYLFGLEASGRNFDSGILSGEEALNSVGGFDRGDANTARQVDRGLDDVFPGLPDTASRNDGFSL